MRSSKPKSLRQIAAVQFDSMKFNVQRVCVLEHRLAWLFSPEMAIHWSDAQRIVAG
jgi:hypothetical protein